MTRVERAALAVVVVLTAFAAVGRFVSGIPTIVSFILAALALAGLAWVVSFSTEQVGTRFGPSATGTLQASVGNLPEFFVVLFALQAKDTVVAQTAILGSVFVNGLLVLGIVLIAGSVKAPKGIMRFSARLPNDTATLMLVASITIVLIGILAKTHDPAGAHKETISIVGAAAMLIVYAIWMRQNLRADISPEDATGDFEPARISIPTAVLLLIAAGAGSAFASDWFIHALEPTIHDVHLSQAFAGIVIVAIAGNAAENFAGIYLALRGKTDLALSVVKSSVSQIAAFLYPLLVLVSLLTASRLTFALDPVWIGALLGTALLMWQITGDGEATPFEGSALIAVYLVLATIAAFEH